MILGRFALGFIVGAVAALLFAYRKQLIALWENRSTVSTAQRTVSGAVDAFEGVKSLWSQVQK